MRAITLSRKSFWLLVPFVVLGWVLGAAGAAGAAFVVVVVGLVLCPFANLITGEPPVLKGAEHAAAKAGIPNPRVALARNRAQKQTKADIARAAQYTPEEAEAVIRRGKAAQANLDYVTPRFDKLVRGQSAGCAGCRVMRPHKCAFNTGME